MSVYNTQQEAEDAVNAIAKATIGHLSSDNSVKITIHNNSVCDIVLYDSTWFVGNFSHRPPQEIPAGKYGVAFSHGFGSYGCFAYRVKHPSTGSIDQSPLLYFGFGRPHHIFWKNKSKVEFRNVSPLSHDDNGLYEGITYSDRTSSTETRTIHGAEMCLTGDIDYEPFPSNSDPLFCRFKITDNKPCEVCQRTTNSWYRHTFVTVRNYPSLATDSDRHVFQCFSQGDTSNSGTCAGLNCRNGIKVSSITVDHVINYERSSTSTSLFGIPIYSGLLYAVNGVCHQASNRIMYALTGDLANTLSLADVPTYAATFLAYGPYGIAVPGTMLLFGPGWLPIYLPPPEVERAPVPAMFKALSVDHEVIQLRKEIGELGFKVANGEITDLESLMSIVNGKLAKFNTSFVQGANGAGLKSMLSDKPLRLPDIQNVTVPEFNMNDATLVLGACYGLADVTLAVAYLANQKNKFFANNDTFTDTWPNVVKHLVVMTRCHNDHHIHTTVYTEGAEVNPADLKTGANVVPVDDVPKVLGAVYGNRVVTKTLQSQFAVNATINVNNSTMGGDPLPNVRKMLYVVYGAYVNKQMNVYREIVNEGENLTFKYEVPVADQVENDPNRDDQ